MNAVGKMHSSFGTSALLVSERGGFVVPAAPSGVAIGASLGSAGPLVTNISVDVSQAGIKTTYKMDLYTASFGKMQKQKLDNLSNISRNRQKQRDERNALIRKGIGKNQNNINYQQLYKHMENSLRFGDQDTDLVTGGLAAQPADISVVSVLPKNSKALIVPDGKAISEGTKGSTTYRHVEASMMSSSMLAYGADFLGHSSRSLGFKYYNSASSSIHDDKAAASYEPDHPNMSSVAKNNADIITKMNLQPEDDLSNFSSWS